MRQGLMRWNPIMVRNRGGVIRLKWGGDNLGCAGQLFEVVRSLG